MFRKTKLLFGALFGSQLQIIDLMVHLNQEKGVTFIFATHDPRVVKHARRVVQIQDGKIRSADRDPSLVAAMTPAILIEKRPA